MLETARIVEQIIGRTGTLAKQSILIYNKDNARLKAILKFIYDPYNKCGIGEVSLKKKLFELEGEPSVLHEPEEVIEYLTKNNTGSDAALNYAARFVLSVDREYNEPAVTFLAMSLVTQNLKMGVSTKTLNKAFGADFIPVIGCMLGTLYSSVNKPNWPCIVTEKLDGIRRILIKQDDKVRMFSRSGHEDFGLVDIFEEAKYLPDNYVYDGELIAIGDFADNIACRQATSSIANAGGNRKGLALHVFDMIPVDEFYAGVSKHDSLNRKTLLAATFKDNSLQHLRPDDWATLIAAFGIDQDLDFIKSVPILGVANSLEDITPLVEALWADKKEGIMLNYVKSKYEVKRSKDLMKIKYSTEVVLKVVDILEGSGKFDDTMGSLVVDYKGSKVGVGSGFTDQQRDTIWNNRPYYVGKMIEIETFGESTNTTGTVSLNCPIFKRFVGED